MSRPVAFVGRHRVAAAAALAALVCSLAVGVWLGVHTSAAPATPLQTLFLEYQDYLLARPGVVSVGIGERNSGSFIQVYVRRLSRRVTAAIPRRLGGWPVSVKAVKVRTPRPTQPTPTPSSTPSRASQMTIDTRGTVVAVVILARPASTQPLGWLLLETTSGGSSQAQLVSIAVTPTTTFFQLQGNKLQPLPATTFGRALRGRSIEVGLTEPMDTSDLTQVTAVGILLDE